ncbi:P-loop containing nucleoside triphosphate hydrolase protein [Xylariaceae sp. AK1471]|nr:P-loop containing nucleoside triphosphate hydrolase protein [Xylariaceae sp. AK1471]
MAQSHPSSDHFREVMTACNCSRDRAIDLLSLHQDNVERAIRHERFVSRYQPRPSNSSTTTEEGVGQTVQEGPSAFGDSSHENAVSVEPSHANAKAVILAYEAATPISTSAWEVSRYPLRAENNNSDLTKRITADWDFILPQTFPPAILTLNYNFSVVDLVGATTHGYPLNQIQYYLECYDPAIVKQEINESIDGFPAIFFAVATNDDMIVRTFVKHGADIAAVHEHSKTPLLAFAIVHGDIIQADTSSMVATLLSLGALPCQLPAGLYNTYDQDLNSQVMVDPSMAWCTTSMMARLQKAASLSQRYYLYRATKIKQPSQRHRQVARLKNAEPLLGIPFFLIGQTMASNRLLQKLLSHLIIPSKRPLVLVFAGPSGHGKTELARHLGHLLSLDLEVVDCTIVSREIELFGPREPYIGAQKGSSLNNFLANHAEKRCIVFLDEFEKTTAAIHQSLLLPFDSGEYQDRRHGTTIDCSQTIWILATNALDPTIKSFCSDNPEILGSDESVALSLSKQLSQEIRKEFLKQFHAPLTGRISGFIPFLPFNEGEQAVVAHKFLLDLRKKVRDPVTLSSDKAGQLIGNIHLRIRRDVLVCRTLAAAQYNPDLGARSLLTAVQFVQDKLVELYLEEEDEIVEGGEIQEFCVEVQDSEVVVSKP